MNYEPAPTPSKPDALPEYIGRELRRLSATIKDSALTVAYLTSAATASLSDGISANWKVPAGNVIRLSTSNTVTLTGLADTTPNRTRTFINVGTGVVVFKNAGTESSASYRFALPSDWQLSADAACTLWYDAISARHRGISRT